MRSGSGSVALWVVLALGVGAGSASGGSGALVFSFDRVESWDQEASPFNSVLSDFATATAGFSATRVDWDLTLTTLGGSFASEARVLVRDAGMNRLAFIRPALGDDFSVSGARYAGSLDLTAIGQGFTLSTDGLFMEFFESFDDQPGAADAVWSGTIAFNLPGPGAAGLLVSCGLLGLRRRR